MLVDNCTGQPGLDGEAIQFTIGTREVNQRVVGMLKEYICG